jgi:hypothetical protein
METPKIQVTHRGPETKWQSEDKKTTLSAYCETRGVHGTPSADRIGLFVLTLSGEVWSGHAKTESQMRVDISAELAAALGDAIGAINLLAFTGPGSLDSPTEFSSQITCPEGYVLYFGHLAVPGPILDSHEAFLGIRGADSKIEIRFKDPENLSQVRSYLRRPIAI